MDPLSIIASSLTIAAATKISSKVLRKVLKADDELGTLIHEVSEAEKILIEARHSLDERTSLQGFPQSHLTRICAYVQDANQKLVSLNKIIEDDLIASYRSNGDLKAARFMWLRKKSKIQKLQQELCEIRLDLPGLWGAVNFSDLSQMRQRFEEQFESYHSKLDVIVGKVENLQHKDAITTSVREVVADSDLEADPSMPSSDIKDVIVVRDMQDYQNILPTQRADLPQKYAVPRIRAPSYRAHRCNSWCSCVCHRIREFQSSEKANFLIGLLSISYSGFSLWSRGCSEHCNQQSIPSLRVTYFLPPWLAERAVHFGYQMTQMGGPELILKMPRIVPSDAMVFSHAIQGNIQAIRELFMNGLASPFDIAHSTGRGVLAHAITYNHHELAQFLIDSGADAHALEKDGRTSVAIAWTRILGNFVTQQSIDTWRSMFDSEEYLESRVFPSLTKIILGLVKADLRTQLELSTNGINEVDTEGRTPLSWAAARGDLDAVKTLLRFHADPNVFSSRGQSPLHFTGQNEFSSCGAIMDALLLAGAEANAVDHWKRTALIYAACNQNAVAPIKLLVDHGADLDAQDLHERTPLSYAARMSRRETLLYLLDSGADPSVPDNWGVTPLMEAIQQNNHDVQRILLRYPISLQTRSKKTSVLLEAATHADLETLKILAEYDFTSQISEAFKNGISVTEVFEQRKALTAEHQLAFEMVLQPKTYRTEMLPADEIEAENVDFVITMPGSFPD
jgi:ankyrin repeat protein